MAHKLTLPDDEFDYRLGDDLDGPGLYEVRRRSHHAATGRVTVAHIMFSTDCPHQSVAMIAMVDALNGAAS